MNPPARMVLTISLSILAGITTAVAGQAAAPASAPAAERTNTIAAQTRAPGPRIDFARETCDFGRVYEGEIMTCEFQFTNPGDQTLKILAVKPSCGCTQARPYDSEVAPGASGRIPIRLDTEGIRGDFQRAIRISTNAPGREKITLMLKGRSEPPLEVVPPQVVFGILTPAGPPAQSSVRIINHRMQPLKFTKVASEDAAFIPELAERQPGREFELIVKTRPELPPGAYRSWIRMEAGGKEGGELWIPVSAYMPATVEIRPRQIVLPAHPLPKVLTRTLLLEYSGPGNLPVPRVGTNHADIQVRVKKLSGQSFQIAVRFPRGFLALPAEAPAVTIETPEPSPGVYKIPVVSGSEGQGQHDSAAHSGGG